jgi:hypothetical protein
MPYEILPVAPSTFDDVYRRLIEDNGPTIRMDREREHVLYTQDHGPLIVLGPIALAREVHTSET